MARRSVDLSPRGAALVAGFGYVVLFVFSTIALSLVDGRVVRGDAATTASNITASASSFRLGIASWLAVLALDSVIAWSLYIFMKPAGSQLSLLAAWFRIIYVAVAAVTLVSLLSAVQLLGRAGDSAAFGPTQLASLAMLSLKAYEFGLNVGFVFFGLHILCLGYLILRTAFVPKVIGVLLLAAAAGYFIDSIASVISPAYGDNGTLFVVFVGGPALVAEYSFAFWLLVRGGKSGPLAKPLTVPVAGSVE